MFRNVRLICIALLCSFAAPSFAQDDIETKKVLEKARSDSRKLRAHEIPTLKGVKRIFCFVVPGDHSDIVVNALNQLKIPILQSRVGTKYEPTDAEVVVYALSVGDKCVGSAELTVYQPCRLSRDSTRQFQCATYKNAAPFPGNDSAPSVKSLISDFVVDYVKANR